MKKFLTVSLLFAVSAMAESMTGYISDSHCGAAHTADKPNEACVKKCIKGGSDAVFVKDGKVYKIADTSKDKVMPLIGQKVKVDGNIQGDTLTVESIEAGS